MKLAVFSDFDGTITTVDTLVTVFDNFIGPSWLEIEKELIEGRISQRESLSKETMLLKGTKEEHLSHIKKIAKLREGFIEFTEFLNGKQIPFTILSGGFKTYINEFLKFHSIAHFCDKSFANDIEFKEGVWQVIPSKNKGLCEKCLHCKTSYIENAKKDGFKVIYIGDGQTDICAALRSDIVFARGTLKRVLAGKGKNFFPFETFKEIKESLTHFLPTSF